MLAIFAASIFVGSTPSRLSGDQGGCPVAPGIPISTFALWAATIAICVGGMWIIRRRSTELMNRRLAIGGAALAVVAPAAFLALDFVHCWT